MFKVNDKNTRRMSTTSFWCFYSQLWIYFIPFTRASPVDFEQVNDSWVNEANTFLMNAFKKLLYKQSPIAKNNLKNVSEIVNHLTL